MARGGASKPMADKYSGPYKVLERGNKAWKLQVGERVDVVSSDRLKPHLGSVAPKAAQAQEAEDGLCGFCGFRFWCSGARRACLAVNKSANENGRNLCVVYSKIRQLNFRNKSVYLQLSQYYYFALFSYFSLRIVHKIFCFARKQTRE